MARRGAKLAEMDAQAMRPGAVFIAIAAAVLLATHAAADSAKLIFRIDDAHAAIVKRHLVISVRGAVRTGGWAHTQLRVMPASAAEGDTLEVDVVAIPPPADDVVVQALLPVSTTAVVHLPRYGAKQVKFVSETNSVTAPIKR